MKRKGKRWRKGRSEYRNKCRKREWRLRNRYRKRVSILRRG